MFAVLGHGSRRLGNDDCVWLRKLRVLAGGRAGYAPTNDRALKLTPSQSQRTVNPSFINSQMWQVPLIAFNHTK